MKFNFKFKKVSALLVSGALALTSLNASAVQYPSYNNFKKTWAIPVQDNSRDFTYYDLMLMSGTIQTMGMQIGSQVMANELGNMYKNVTNEQAEQIKKMGEQRFMKQIMSQSFPKMFAPASNLQSAFVTQCYASNGRMDAEFCAIYDLFVSEQMKQLVNNKQQLNQLSQQTEGMLSTNEIAQILSQVKYQLNSRTVAIIRNKPSLERDVIRKTQSLLQEINSSPNLSFKDGEQEAQSHFQEIMRLSTNTAQDLAEEEYSNIVR